MEIDFALINEVNDFKEDYYQDYLNIINEASKQLEISDDLELSCILVDDQKYMKLIKNIVILIELPMLLVLLWKIVSNIMLKEWQEILEIFLFQLIMH